jgi:hypothetical protein
VAWARRLKEEQYIHEEADGKKTEEIRSVSMRARVYGYTLMQLREQLDEAERYIAQVTAGGGINNGLAPLALQPLLRKCMDIEMSFVRRDNDKSYEEFKTLLESVERMKQRQTSPVQSFKLAFGTSNDAELLDKRIAQCK